jgi:alkanesulfonate monooxygenase SsuD/methylene tetrahydromethanopterin reductase-like flavin-dependent oxidoreductase (luciferase family)
VALCLARFNLIDPAGTPPTNASRYRAMLEMAAFVDQAGFFGVNLEEHHGAANGWSPTPLLNAGMILARTERISVTVSALLLPLHDPIRVAEDIAVLDLVSGGRLITVAGIGYRPEEYHLLGKDWEHRGALMDDGLATLLAAWTGEPFEYRGQVVQVTPRPLSDPHPTVLVGGSSKVAARRAARLGLPMFLPKALPELKAYYKEQCAAHGTSGFVVDPPEDTAMIFVAEDPDEVWANAGHHFLHEAATYRSWQTSGIHSAVRSEATTVDELRAEGVYQVLTPNECVARSTAGGPATAFTHHPLCGGMPIERGWSSLQLFVDQVLPRI